MKTEKPSDFTKLLTPAPQADEERDDLPDNDPGTDGVDPNTMGGEDHA